MQPDDDVVEQGEQLHGAVEYTPSDSTAEVPFPRRYVFILPRGLQHPQLWSLPHPRHGELACYVTGTSEDGKALLCEVQERRHAFGDTWFLDDHVEPSSALHIATPTDLGFVAAAVAHKGPLADKFVLADTMVQEREPSLAALPPSLLSALQRSLMDVCDIKSIGPDENYCRFSAEKFGAWIKRKHRHVASSPSLRTLIGLGADEAALTDEQREVLNTKAFALLAEYLPPSLQEVALEACGVAAAQQKQAAQAAARPQHAPPSPSSQEAESDSKKPRLELKSASVKRLEKAGPPKGTPTLMAMFAKKAAATQSHSSPSSS